MAGFLLQMKLVTDEDRARGTEYLRERFLYNKYTEEELRDWTKIDIYAALDLDCFRYSEIPKYVLKYAIRRKATLYHPLRNQNKETAFILIKQAETLLAVPRYRKLYDSVTLDENIPEDREYTLGEFLEAFSGVFERNAIFSETRPVPGLADSTVDVFYKFWHNFKSTRVYDDPEDVFEQRGSTRRYNAAQKKDILQKRKQADALRIMNIVKLAYKRDPRIKRTKVAPTVEWKDAEIKSLEKFNMLLGKHKNKFAEIAKKLNLLHLSKRTPQEVKNKIETMKKK